MGEGSRKRMAGGTAPRNHQIRGLPARKVRVEGAAIVCCHPVARATAAGAPGSRPAPVCALVWWCRRNGFLQDDLRPAVATRSRRPHWHVRLQRSCVAAVDSCLFSKPPVRAVHVRCRGRGDTAWRGFGRRRTRRCILTCFVLRTQPTPPCPRCGRCAHGAMSGGTDLVPATP